LILLFIKHHSFPLTNGKAELYSVYVLHKNINALYKYASTFNCRDDNLLKIRNFCETLYYNELIEQLVKTLTIPIQDRSGLIEFYSCLYSYQPETCSEVSYDIYGRVITCLESIGMQKP
jgi:hypothetical protein